MANDKKKSPDSQLPEFSVRNFAEMFEGLAQKKDRDIDWVKLREDCFADLDGTISYLELIGDSSDKRDSGMTWLLNLCTECEFARKLIVILYEDNRLLLQGMNRLIETLDEAERRADAYREQSQNFLDRLRFLGTQGKRQYVEELKRIKRETGLGEVAAESTEGGQDEH
jgi:hypothetical protein